MENTAYSENSKHDFKAVLKLVYKWLKGNDEIYPPEIAWLKARLRNTVHKLPEELLTEDEVMQMAKMADYPRDKAFLLVLYESGCRIGELLSLRMKHVSFDQYGAVLHVRAARGGRRRACARSGREAGHGNPAGLLDGLSVRFGDPANDERDLER